MSTLYDSLKSLCAQRGVTGAEMCRAVGVSKSMMTSLKTGRVKSISLETAQKIADYFGVPVDTLQLGENIEKAPTLSGESSAPDDIILLNRAANNMTPEQRRQLIEMAKVVFADAFKS